jgi:hypothetical protein
MMSPNLHTVDGQISIFSFIIRYGVYFPIADHVRLLFLVFLPFSRPRMEPQNRSPFLPCGTGRLGFGSMG